MNERRIHLLDTSTWVLIYRRDPPVAVAQRVEELIRERLAASNSVVELELVVGCRTPDEMSQVRTNLASLQDLQILQSTWNRAASLGFELRRVGITTSVPDLLIATSAIEHDAILLHVDGDFDEIAKHSNLRVESYLDIAN